MDIPRCVLFLDGVFTPEAEFLDVLGTKVEFSTFLFTVNSTNGSPPPPTAKVV